LKVHLLKWFIKLLMGPVDLEVRRPVLSALIWWDSREAKVAAAAEIGT
jgi:hypothetical protein